MIPLGINSRKLTERFLSSDIKEELVQRIRRETRIAFRDWMETALYHPTLGYYNRSNIKRWGRDGDYRTSPERSGLFAATFANYFLNLHKNLGSPSEFTIVEVGGGDGSFALGALEALERKDPAVLNSTRYIFAEAGRDARKRAKEKLYHFRDSVEFKDLDTIGPIKSGIVFSNELLDAFPVHRVTKIDDQLKELFVTLDESSEFTWRASDLSSPELREYCHSYLTSLAEGQSVEVNLEIKHFLGVIRKQLLDGYVVTVDYGAEVDELYGAQHRQQGTLRGFKHHQFVENILATPGENDITSTVNWTDVIAEGRRNGFAVEEFLCLDQFLIKTGFVEELESALAQETTEASKARLTTAARETILPSGMAASFHVLVQKRNTNES